MRSPLVFLLTVFLVSASVGQEPPNSQAVEAARQRQTAVKSVKVTFAIREVREKGSATYLVEKVGSTPPDPVPPPARTDTAVLGTRGGVRSGSSTGN